jgi:hypothetical protein
MNRWAVPTPAAGIGSAIAVALVVFGLYVLTMPTVLPASGDAMAQTQATLRQPIELNPHHLLVTPIDRIALAIGHAAPSRAFLPIQILNALAGATACGLFLLWLARLGIPLLVALPYTLALAFTFVHWLHSREAETGILANLFLLLTVNLLPLATSRRLPIVFPAASAVLAILCALNTAALIPALGLMDSPDHERRGRQRMLAAFLVATAVGALVAFLVLPWMSAGMTPNETIARLTSHPGSARLAEHGQVSVSNALRAGSGLINAFTGDTAVTTALKARLQNRGSIPLPPGDWIRFGIGAFITLFLLLALLDRPHTGRERLLWLAAWAALVPTAIFNLLWLGSDPQFWLPILPFLGAWSAAWIVRGVRSRRPGSAPPATAIIVPTLVAVALAFCNWPLAVPTILDPKGGSDWQRARTFAERAVPGDILIYNGGFGPYLQAISKTKAVSLVYGLPAGKKAYEHALFELIDDHLDGGRLFALNVFGPATAVNTGGWEEIRAISGRGREEWIELLRARYNFFQPATPPDLGDLWQLTIFPRPELPPTQEKANP